MDENLKQEFSNIQQIYTTVTEFMVNYSFQIVGALLIIIIGIFVAKKISKLIVGLCEKKNIDITLRTYIGHIIYLVILVCFIIIALGKIGISITPFVAAIGAISLGAGLALQGLLSNYGAGISIIISRPFKVGDTITIHDVAGEVQEIKLSCTIIRTEDGEEILIPNRHIVGEIIHNSFENKLVETIIGIDYSNDPDEAVSAIRSALGELEFVSRKPEPQIGIDTFADSSINIGIRFWVPTRSYYDSMYKANRQIFRAVKQAGLSIPYPKLDLNWKRGERQGKGDKS